MTLYCGKRFVFVPRRGGTYSLTVTTRGWFMGDMMTKVILTIVHDYSMRLCDLQVYSLVGDDEVVLSRSRKKLHHHLEVLEQTGFKISQPDTYISRRLMFYCEEGSLVPQGPSFATHVSMRRGTELGYLDYPRIRLLLSQKSETDSYSMTNIGRFSLLGKETKWCYSVNKPAVPLFETASLLQHIIVPQDTDTLCPFTPLEMGGDGSFISDPVFLNKVVQDKCRDPREALYRMSSLMTHSFNFRFVRSERTTEVAHKHHFMMPVYEELSKYLGDAVIRPRDSTQKTLLRSLKVKGLETPEHTWLRLCRGFHYEQVFKGKLVILEPKFEKKLDFKLGRTEDPSVGLMPFIRHWANPGFRFVSPSEYWVQKDLVERVDPLNLQWRWESVDFLRYPSAFEIYSNYLRDEVDFTETAFSDVINLLTRNTPLPERVLRRLNLFMESDSYILSTLPPGPKAVFGLVTRDLRLCAEVRKRLKGPSSECIVYALDPTIYLAGLMYVGKDIRYIRCNPPPDDLDWVEDAGALLHADYTEFTDGFAHDRNVTGWEEGSTFHPGYPIVGQFHRYHTGVVVIRLDHSANRGSA